MAKLIARLYARYERYICKQLDALITVTPTQTDYYKRINSNTVEIRNYPIISEIQCIPRDRDTIAFAGGITHQWNHDVVIRALNSIDNAKYVLCGPANNYLNELKKINGWEKVHYLGKIQHEMVSSVLSKATIGVALLTPSSNTGGKNGTMGNTKIFEEMMAGLPVVCTNFVLWRDFIDRYQCGICVNPLSEKEVIAAFKYLLNNPEEARRMGDNGIKAIKEEYNWKIEEKKLFELYDLVLGYK